MKKIFLLIIVFFLLVSCSIKYEEGQNLEDVIPEFAFSNVKFSRFEEREKKMKMDAQELEQYKDGHSMYAKNVAFEVYEDGDISTDGICSFLGIDTDSEIYELYENIRIYNKKQNMEVFGKNFRWNGKTEQLTSGRNDIVTINKDGLTVQGSGFSASAVSSSFIFSGVVTGDIETEDDVESEEN